MDDAQANEYGCLPQSCSQTHTFAHRARILGLWRFWLVKKYSTALRANEKLLPTFTPEARMRIEMANPTRPCNRNTRRQWLQIGTLSIMGIMGMNVAEVLTGLAIAEHSASRRIGQSSIGSQVLEPCEPAEVGMSAERLDRIAHRLLAETKDGGITSVSVLVARHGKVIFHRGFGKLSPHPNAPVTGPDTCYLLASISKPVTVCGLMLLIEHGKVVLSDSVQRYLPEFQGDYRKKVKVWHLLSHTSGLPDMLPTNVELRRAHAPLSEFVAQTLRTPLLYEPGTRFSYQSMGTLLAAEITERISGMPLRDFLLREIFQPLNMKNSVLGLDGLNIEDTAIIQEENGDSEDSRSWGPNSPYWRDMGHPWGGLHSTTGDLAILLQTFLNGGTYGQFQLFSPLITDTMTRDHNRSIAAPWGIGWALRDSPVWNYFGDLGSSSTFGHVGASGTVAWADPASQLIGVVLSTRSASHEQGFFLKSLSNMIHAAVIE